MSSVFFETVSRYCLQGQLLNLISKYFHVLDVKLYCETLSKYCLKIHLFKMKFNSCLHILHVLFSVRKCFQVLSKGLFKHKLFPFSQGAHKKEIQQ